MSTTKSVPLFPAAAANPAPTREPQRTPIGAAVPEENSNQPERTVEGAMGLPKSGLPAPSHVTRTFPLIVVTRPPDTALKRAAPSTVSLVPENVTVCVAPDAFGAQSSSPAVMVPMAFTLRALPSFLTISMAVDSETGVGTSDNYWNNPLYFALRSGGAVVCSTEALKTSLSQGSIFIAVSVGRRTRAISVSLSVIGAVEAVLPVVAIWSVVVFRLD